MSTFSTTKEGIYFDISVGILGSIIVSIILITEAIVWCSKTRAAKAITNMPQNQSQNPNTMEMSISQTKTDSDQTSSVSAPSVDPMIHLLPIGMYISYVITLVTFPLSYLGVGIHRNCHHMGLSGFFFAIAKCFMYSVFLYRLERVYSNSVFQKNTKTLKIAAVVMNVWIILIATLNLFTMTETVLIVDERVYCSSQTAPIVFLGIFVADLSVNIGCCYAFTRPLFWLSKLESDCTETNTIYNTVVKYIVLTVVSIVSTLLIMVIMGITKLMGLGVFDNVINCLCIMLFNHFYDPFYQCICCGAHKIGHGVMRTRCCGGGCAHQKSTEKNKNIDSKDIESTSK